MMRTSTTTTPVLQTNRSTADANTTTAGFAVLIEDDPLEKFTSTRKTFAPVAYGDITFSPTELTKSKYAKDILVKFFGFLFSKNLDIYFLEPRKR